MTILDITTPLTLPPSKAPRSPGQHASGIIRPLAAEVGFLDKKWCEDLSLVDTREITDPIAILRIRIGLAWEEHLIPTLEGVVDHPGELELQGVYMTPDGESVDRVLLGSRGIELIVHEVKATYKSSRRNIREQWMWLTQLKSYCKALNTRFARLYILFICGDYSYPITPQHLIYEIEFSQDELDASWTMLVDYLQMRLQTDAVLNTEEI
jgi:hypothetical protein